MRQQGEAANLINRDEALNGACLRCRLLGIAFSPEEGGWVFPAAILPGEFLHRSNPIYIGADVSVHVMRENNKCVVVRDAPTAIYIMINVLKVHPHHEELKRACFYASFGLAPPLETCGHELSGVVRNSFPALYPYQVESVSAMVRIFNEIFSGKSRLRGIILADEMGLGKTVQAAAVISLAKEIRRVLVVCPTVMVMKFYDHLKKWCTRPANIAVLTRFHVGTSIGLREWIKDPPDGGLKVGIVNYDYIKQAIGHLGEAEGLVSMLPGEKRRQYRLSVDLLVCDEAHYLKNERAQRTKNILGSFASGQYQPGLIEFRSVLLMTGTPIKNRVEDLYTLLKSVAPGQWRKSEFLTRYCAFSLERRYSKRGKFRLAYVRKRDPSRVLLEELACRMRSSCMIRRKKSEVLSLPPKTRDIIRLEGALASEAKALSSAKAMMNQMGFSQAASSILRLLTEARAETAKLKIPFAAELAQDILDNGHSVVIFTYHRAIAEEIAARLGVECITGEMHPHIRVEKIRRFNSATEPTAIVATMSSVGVGVDFVGADSCIFVELDWVPSTLLQAEDRLHRISQSKPVTCYYLVFKRSIDERITNVLMQKIEESRVGLGDKKTDLNLADAKVSPVDVLVEILREDEGDDDGDDQTTIEEAKGAETAS
ncbi:MAG: hypothetical protein KatS3mg054_0134 [Chloroflexus sp.]|nr:MAG: hypothetical protein KatS3mg054_0134 [Chloroflexus sp.]